MRKGQLYQLLGQRAVCILKCAVLIGQYTHTVCSIQCKVYSVQPTVCSEHLFPCQSSQKLHLLGFNISLLIGPETTFNRIKCFLANRQRCRNHDDVTMGSSGISQD